MSETEIAKRPAWNTACEACGEMFSQERRGRRAVNCGSQRCLQWQAWKNKHGRAPPLSASAWAISIREDVRKVAAHPCIYGPNAACKRCATCRARADLAQLETARAPVQATLFSAKPDEEGAA